MTHQIEDFDRGLAFDVARMFERRQALKLLAGGGALAFLAACGNSSKDGGGNTAVNVTTTNSSTTNSTATTSNTTAAECPTEVPSETAGPYPGDGSNGPNALADPAVVRSDITASFGDYAGIAEGVATTINLTVLDGSNGCKPLAGGAVYLWHADREGHYSMYTAPDANYLRGVGEADANGTVTFQSVWPGCYDGRWPHIHFEVYPSVDDARAAANLIKTSQIALPAAACETIYAAERYEASLDNLSRVSLESDNVFNDGWEQELGTAIGSNESGWTLALTITI